MVLGVTDGDRTLAYAAAQAAKQPLRARMVKADEAARVLGVPEKQVQCYLLG
jgi:hypothetical protein